MAFLVDAELTDVNGVKAYSSAWTATRADGIAFLTALKNATNAAITSATISTPVPIQTITNNTASNNNVETCRTKAKVRMRGADAGSLAQPFAYTTIGIPAPVGTLINGLTGDNLNTDLVALVPNVLSASGVTMSTIEKVYYSRSR